MDLNNIEKELNELEKNIKDMKNISQILEESKKGSMKIIELNKHMIEKADSIKLIINKRTEELYNEVIEHINKQQEQMDFIKNNLKEPIELGNNLLLQCDHLFKQNNEFKSKLILKIKELCDNNIKIIESQSILNNNIVEYNKNLNNKITVINNTMGSIHELNKKNNSFIKILFLLFFLVFSLMGFIFYYFEFMKI